MLGMKKTTGSRYKGNNYKDHSFVASNTEVLGDIKFTGGLHVEGRVTGNIVSEDGCLHVHMHGEVVGDIHVPHIIINGATRGSIYAGAHIELAAKAMVTGNVYYTSMEMMLGAQVNGSLMYSEQAKAQLIEHQPVVAQVKEAGAD